MSSMSLPFSRMECLPQLFLLKPVSFPTSLSSCVLVCTGRFIMSLLLHSVIYKSCFLVSLHVTGGSDHLSASRAVRQKEQRSGRKETCFVLANQLSMLKAFDLSNPQSIAGKRRVWTKCSLNFPLQLHRLRVVHMCIQM